MDANQKSSVARMSLMASGHLCLEFKEAMDWDSFAQFATRVLNRIGAKVTEKADAVDMRIWALERCGVKLRLVYEDYPSQASLESSSPEGDEHVRQIADLLATPDSPP